jgi:uncharacterized protein YgiM (DUF1202 family)
MPQERPMPPQQPMPSGPQDGGQANADHRPPMGALEAYITNVGVLNMRQGPGLDYPIVGTVPVGTKVSLTGQTDGKWRQIRHPNGTFGWVNDYYLTHSLAYVTTGIVEPTYAKGMINTGYGLNVRSGPGLAYARVGGLYYGDNVYLMGESSADGSWVKIKMMDGTVGWVASMFVTRL